MVCILWDGENSFILFFISRNIHHGPADPSTGPGTSNPSHMARGYTQTRKTHIKEVFIMKCNECYPRVSICLWVLSLEVFLISETSPRLETREGLSPRRLLPAQWGNDSKYIHRMLAQSKRKGTASKDERWGAYRECFCGLKTQNSWQPTTAFSNSTKLQNESRQS